MKLSQAATQSLMATGAAVAAPYSELAKSLAISLAANKAHIGEVTKERATIWDTFKSACFIGQKAKHDQNALRAGLEIACVNAGIPSGSFRGYVSTVESLYGDLRAGKLSAAQVREISVKDARERYMDEGKKALAEAKAKLAEAIKEWKPTAILELAAIAAKANEKAAKPPAAKAKAKPKAKEQKAANG